MTWTSVQEAVRDAIAEALGLEDFLGADDVTPVQRVAWENQVERQSWHTGAWVDLRLSRVRGVHQDEMRRTYTAGATPELSTLIPTSGGMREFTVTVVIGNDSQRSGEEAVGELADKLRRRIRWEGVLGDLQEAGVALVDVGQILNADFRDAHGAMNSRAFVDLRLRAVFTETDTSAAGSWIASATGQGADDSDLETVVFDTED